MKYLLGYLEGISDAPSIADPDFQQLLVDVHLSKPQKSSDAFYDSLEKVVNELKGTPEAVPFLKPVSKRDAPDYYQYIDRPMDLSTVLRNVKGHKYKAKADFAADLDQIWKNCLTYNTTANHPLRAVAKFLQQKTNHLLDFVADKEDSNNNPLLAILSQAGASTAVQRAVMQQQQTQQGGVDGAAPNAEDEDAAGESDDAAGEEDESARKGDKDNTPGHGAPNGRATSEANASQRATSAGLAPGERRVNGKAKSSSPPPFRPNLQANLEAPALIRTPYTMTQLQPVLLNTPGPSFSDKGKAREILYGNAPPAWYPVSVTTDDEDAKLEGYWWGLNNKDESYVSGLPAVPCMVEGPSRKRRRIGRRQPIPSTEQDAPPGEPAPPPLVPSKPVSLERVIQRSMDKLSDARKTMGVIQDWQRYYDGDGTVMPPTPLDPPEVERARLAQERAGSKRKRQESRTQASERFKQGGEVGEEEATLSLKRAAASMLANAGFEGANEIPLDLFTRVAGDYLRNLGRTFRMYLDGFSQQVDSEELVLHVLHENGQVELQDLETHIKDDIERDSAKASEMQRKVRAAYKEMLAGPVIEDDMLLAQDGEMLKHGEFAEDLGEDFLGLRELGIDKEFGLASVTVPRALFFGRRRRAGAAAEADKTDAPDYTPPPPVVPLNPATFRLHTPGLLHAFYAARLEAGTGIDKDDAFDPVHAAIGPLGQIIVKKPVPGTPAKKPAKKAADDKKSTKQVGVGKGKWIRPPKEERDRRAAEKKAALAKQAAEAAAAAAAAGEEDAAGEDE